MNYQGLFPMSLASGRQPAIRLAVGLGLSMLAHLLIIASVRPMAVAYSPPRALQVEIRHIADGLDALLGVANEAEAPDIVASPPLSTPPAPAGTQAMQPNTAAQPVAGPDLRFAAENYLAASELDVRAEPLNEVELVYPQLAYQMRTRGKVTLRILINERGGIDQVSVLDSEPRGTFEDAALTATWALRFSPAKKYGRNVKSQKTIEVNFDPYERIGTP
jgi:periplasmic protein TonB